MSNYDIMFEKGALNRRLEILESERYACIQKLQNLQSRCDHEVVIHYGEDPISSAYQRKFFMGHIYCPHCGHHRLKVTLKNQAEDANPHKENCNKKTHFILEASGFRGNNITLNLKAVLNRYIYYVDTTENNTPARLIQFLQQHNIPHYEGFVSTW